MHSFSGEGGGDGDDEYSISSSRGVDVMMAMLGYLWCKGAGHRTSPCPSPGVHRWIIRDHLAAVL